MANAVTASGGPPAGTLTVRGASEQISLSPERPFVVGRALACDLVVNDARVSRRHLMLEPSPQGWTAIDISANGTWHDGQRVQRLRIRQECRLRLGAVDGPEITISPSKPRKSKPAPPAEPPTQPLAGPRREPAAVRSTPAAVASAPPPPRAAGGADHYAQETYLERDAPARGPMLPGGQRAAVDSYQPRTHQLRLGRMSIGRALTNDIVVGDLLASREHAELLVGRGGTEIVDLGSSNGTFVNGHRVARALLNPGDYVAIGHHVFHVGDGVLHEQVDTGDVAFEVDSISVDAGETRLLHDMTFRLPGRALLAVLGPSGAGKSTLLNALTGFRPANVGTVRYAGRDLYAEYDDLRRKIGYVPQDDILHTSLTVREALEFGAKLRFPADTTDEERRQRIEEVLVELALTNRPSAGGTPAVSGGNDLADRQVSKLSGGQRKRTSVALELLTQPTLLYLDEPTSGLDPGMDKEVMVALRRLADGGRTVIVVTHSVAQLNLCDYLLVLAKGGRLAYFGPPQQALDFFGVADWADVFTMLQTDEGAARVTQQYRSSEFFVRASSTRPAIRREPEPIARIRQQPVLSQLLTLSRRYMRVIASDKAYLRLLCIYPFILGLIPLVIPSKYGLELGPNGEPNAQAATVLLVVVIMACFMGTSNSIRELVKEREIYRRERAVGLSTMAYLGSKVLVLSVITALQGIVLAGIGLMTRFPPDGALFSGAAWLEMMIAVVALAVASVMIGLILSAFVDNADKTMPPLVVFVMANLVFTGGLLALADKAGLNQLSWLFPTRWGYAALAATVDLNNVTGAGTPEGEANGLRVDPLWEHSGRTYLLDVAALVVLGVLALVVTALLLRRLDPQPSGGRTGGGSLTTRLAELRGWRPQSSQVRAWQSRLQQSGIWQARSAQSPAGPSRSWRRWLLIALPAVLAATVVLVVADRAALAFTRDQIRDRVVADLAEHQVEYGSLAVDVTGIPFLTQAFTRTLDEIRISMTDLRPPTGDVATVTIATVDAVATNVRINVGDFLRGEPTATAEQVAGTAVITYAALDELVALPGLSLADIHFSESDGAIRFEALGALAPVQAIADITVEDGLLRIRLREAQFNALTLPPLGQELLNQLLAVTIDLVMPPLPLGLTLQAVTPKPEGVAIDVVGQEVPLAADS